MSSEPFVYLRGEFVPASQAHISIYDFGIVLGATVTDLARTFHRKTYRLADHLRRFHESCKYARIAPPASEAETVGITEELVRRNAALLPAGGELGIVYFITPGESAVYAGSAAGSAALTPTFCVHTFPMPFELFARFFTEGVHVVTPSTRHVPPQCVDPKTDLVWPAQEDCQFMSRAFENGDAVIDREWNALVRMLDETGADYAR